MDTVSGGVVTFVANEARSWKAPAFKRAPEMKLRLQSHWFVGPAPVLNVTRRFVPPNVSTSTTPLSSVVLTLSVKALATVVVFGGRIVSEADTRAFHVPGAVVSETVQL